VKERIDHVVNNYINKENLLLVSHATFSACLMGKQLKYKDSIFELFLPRAGRAKYENGKWIMIDTR
jgi:broad specificity phosphatase PhoE